MWSVPYFVINEIKEIQQDLEYIGVGEIWFHTTQNTIEQWLKKNRSRQ